MFFSSFFQANEWGSATMSLPCFPWVCPWKYSNSEPGEKENLIWFEELPKKIVYSSNNSSFPIVPPLKEWWANELVWNFLLCSTRTKEQQPPNPHVPSRTEGNNRATVWLFHVILLRFFFTIKLSWINRLVLIAKFRFIFFRFYPACFGFGKV